MCHIEVCIDENRLFRGCQNCKNLKLRNKAWRKHRATPSTHNYNNYKEVRNKVTTMMTEDREKHQKSLISNFKNNPKRFYGFLRNMQTVKSRHGPIHVFQNVIYDPFLRNITIFTIFAIRNTWATFSWRLSLLLMFHCRRRTTTCPSKRKRRTRNT